MIKKVLVSLLLVVALISVSFGASLKLDSFTTTPSMIKPGDEVDLTLRVQNIVSNNEDPKYSYMVEISPKGTVAENNLIILDGEDNLGRLGANEYWNSKFKFKVLEGAPSTSYDLNVKMKKYLEGSLISVTEVSLSFDVSGETFFQLGADGRTIGQGETKTFDAYIENVGGGNAGSVTVSFANTADISVVGTNSFYFDSINYDEKKDFAITLYAANGLNSGTYTIPVSITYNDGGSIQTQSVDVGVIVGGNIDLRVASVDTTPKEVRPGDNYVLVSINLENAGEDAAKAISAVLNSDVLKSSYSNNNLVYVGRIDSGSYSNLKFYVDVPKESKSGVYKVDLDLSYINLMGEEFNDSLVVPLFVKEKPVLEITNVEASGKTGESLIVKVDITNNGEENAEEVDIRLISDSSLPFTIEERSSYIGSIKSGETKTAIFTVKVSSDADINDYNVRAFLRARGDSEVGDNNIYTYNKDVNISVTGKSWNLLAVFGIGVAVLVVLGMVFRKSKFVSKKKVKKE